MLDYMERHDVCDDNGNILYNVTTVQRMNTPTWFAASDTPTVTKVPAAPTAPTYKVTYTEGPPYYNPDTNARRAMGTDPAKSDVWEVVALARRLADVEARLAALERGDVSFGTLRMAALERGDVPFGTLRMAEDAWGR